MVKYIYRKICVRRTLILNKENRDDYIVISKEKMVNYFFTSILALALVVFIVLMGKAIIVGFNSSSDDLVENIDMDLVSYYKDDFLNITYGIPGGNWGMAEIEDTSGIENVCIASAGEDGVFDIKEDTLTVLGKGSKERAAAPSTA